MKERLLPQGTIECDAVTVHPPPTAVGVGGGFPCQAGPAGFIILSFKFDGEPICLFLLSHFCSGYLKMFVHLCAGRAALLLVISRD